MSLFLHMSKQTENTVEVVALCRHFFFPFGLTVHKKVTQRLINYERSALT